MHRPTFRAIGIGCLLLGSTFTGRAQDGIPYGSSRLSEIAEVVRPAIADLDRDTCYTAGPYKGCPIAVEQRRGQVTHLGIRLFDPEFKRLAGRELCDFAERYLLERIAFADDPERSWMYDSDSVTVSGSLRRVLDADRETVRFSLSDTENRGYALNWSRNDSTLLAITLPAQWQLICGKNQIELEQEFERMLADFDAGIPDPPQIPRGRMERTTTRNVLVCKRGHYTIPQMVSSLYFRVDEPRLPARIERSGHPGVKLLRDRIVADTVSAVGTPRLLLESGHPAESTINLLSVPALGKDYTVEITQRLYGYAGKIFDVPLDRLIACCMADGCRPYVGIEHIDEHSVTALCILVNSRWNYNHILHVTLPIDGFDRRSGKLRAKVNAFAPTHNLETLYDDDRQALKGQSRAPKITIP